MCWETEIVFHRNWKELKHKLLIWNRRLSFNINFNQFELNSLNFNECINPTNHEQILEAPSIDLSRESEEGENGHRRENGVGHAHPDRNQGIPSFNFKISRKRPYSFMINFSEFWTLQ